MQTALVIVTVGAAVFFLGRRIFKQFYGKKDGCDGCGSH